MDKKLSHFPVMVDEIISFINPKNTGYYLDGTFGQGGFTKKIFESYWKEGIDISDSDNLIQIVEELGFNAKKFDAFINSNEAKEQLKLNTNTLIKRGGFGSPTFFYKNMMFFGNDRIPLLESLIS